MPITLIAPITQGPVATDMPGMKWTVYFYNVSADGWVRCGPFTIDHVATESAAHELAHNWKTRNPAKGGGYSTVHVCPFWEYVDIKQD